MQVVLEKTEQPSTSHATGAAKAHAKPRRLTIVDLDDVCLWHVLSYLSLRDSLAFGQTCTRLQEVARLLMPGKFGNLTVRLHIHHKNAFKKESFRHKVKCFSGFSKIELYFEENTAESDMMQHCITVFTILYDYCTRPIDQLTISHLQLTEKLPLAMYHFFARVPVRELTLLNCNFSNEVKINGVTSLRIKPGRGQSARLSNYDLPRVSSLAILSSHYVGLEKYINNNPKLDHLEIHQHANLKDFKLISEQDNIQSLFWLGKFKFANRVPAQDNFPALETLGLKFTNDNFYLRNITSYFCQLDTIRCVSLYVKPPIPRVPFFNMFELLKRFENIQKLEVHNIEFMWKFNHAVEDFCQFIEDTPTLEEIDLTFYVSHFYKYFSKDIFDRILAICETNDRYLKITIDVCDWYDNVFLKMIQAGLTDEYISAVDQYMEIDIRFPPVRKRLHVYSTTYNYY